jgi:hypothetical protein
MPNLPPFHLPWNDPRGPAFNPFLIFAPPSIIGAWNTACLLLLDWVTDTWYLKNEPGFSATMWAIMSLQVSTQNSEAPSPLKSAELFAFASASGLALHWQTATVEFDTVTE